MRRSISFQEEAWPPSCFSGALAQELAWHSGVEVELITRVIITMVIIVTVLTSISTVVTISTIIVSVILFFDGLLCSSVVFGGQRFGDSFPRSIIGSIKGIQGIETMAYVFLLSALPFATATAPSSP